jgi:hypothetical protein
MLANGNTAIDGRLAVGSSVLVPTAADLIVVDATLSPREIRWTPIGRAFEAETQLVADLVVDIA